MYYKLSKEKFNDHNKHLIDVLIKFGVIEDDNYLYIPIQMTQEIEPFDMDRFVYEYFCFVSSTIIKELDIRQISGSKDARNYKNKNWLNDFLSRCSTSENLEKYFSNPLDAFKNENEIPKTFLYNDKYYLADGHHRFECTLMDYYIKESKGESTESIPKTFKAMVRTVPNDLDFVKNIATFCFRNKIYYEDPVDGYVFPLLSCINNDPINPILQYKESDIFITRESDLDEILTKIREYEKQKGEEPHVS